MILLQSFDTPLSIHHLFRILSGDTSSVEVERSYLLGGVIRTDLQARGLERIKFEVIMQELGTSHAPDTTTSRSLLQVVSLSTVNTLAVLPRDCAGTSQPGSLSCCAPQRTLGIQ